MLISGFIIAIIFGGFPEVAGMTNSNISMVSLIVMMSFSLITLQFRGLDVKAHRGAILRSLVLSFVVSSGVTIAMAQLFHGDLKDGWIMVAAVPSAVSVIPFTFLLRGELEATLVSSTALYFASVILTPLITFLFLGQAVSPLTMLGYVTGLILVPMGISRPLRHLKLTEETKHIVINIGFVALIIAVVGSNREVFLGEPIVWISLLAVSMARTFGVGITYNAIARRCGVSRERRVPEVLFATYKNTGAAAAISMLLLGSAAALPAAVLMSAEIIWLIFITRYMAPVGTIR